MEVIQEDGVGKLSMGPEFESKLTALSARKKELEDELKQVQEAHLCVSKLLR